MSIILTIVIFIGSDPGPFFFARYGLYIRPSDTWVIFLAFRGNDVHGGTSPVANPTTMSTWLQDLSPLYDKAGPVNRAVYVHYSGAVPCTRIAPTLVTPPVIFGNSTAFDYTSKYQTISEHGLSVFGSKTTLANHLGREAIFAFHNSLQHSGLSLNMDLANITSCITFSDEQGQSKALNPLPFHPMKDHPTVALKRAWYSWFLSKLQEQAIRITKKQMKEAKEKLGAPSMCRNASTCRKPLFRGHATILPNSGRHSSRAKVHASTAITRSTQKRYFLRQAKGINTGHSPSPTNVSIS
jgi:hypothetical protein